MRRADEPRRLPSWPGRVATQSRGGLLAIAVALITSSCTDSGDPVRRVPLLDDRHAPDVLVESETVTSTPTLETNRFVSGWTPRMAGPLVLRASEAGGRLELANLARRPRRIELDLADSRAPGEVSVRAAGRDLGVVPLADPLVIDLPADLPLGRVMVELVPRGSELSVREVRVGPVLDAGTVRREGRDLVQSGVSRVDLVRPVAAGTELSGTFVPPEDASSEQEFALRVEGEDGSTRTAFEWKPGSLSSPSGEQALRVPLGDSDRFVRIRLEANGAGPPGRWRGLVLAGPAARPSPTPSMPSQRPELVVLYVMDALRADTASEAVGGYARLARDGFELRDHRSSAPNTLPSIKALLTGEAWIDGGGRALPADGPATLAEIFRHAGYRTALFSGNVYVGRAFGTDRGFEHVEEIAPPPEENGTVYNDNVERLHAAALEWLDTLGEGERAFLYVHALHPHNPYSPPPEMAAEETRGLDSVIAGSTRTLLDIQKGEKEVQPEDLERLRRLYAANFAYADRELDRFLTALERRVPRERTLVAATSDHGEEFLEHGGVLHGFTLYEELLHIPLVVSWPGQVKPGSSEIPTSALDLHETLARIAAADASRRGEGTSLWPLLRGESMPGSGPPLRLASAASVKGGIYAARGQRAKLVFAPRTGRQWGQGKRRGRTHSAEYVFDLAADPGEQTNRAGEGSLEAAWLRERLAAWIAGKDSHRGDETAEVDHWVRRRLEALGYVE